MIMRPCPQGRVKGFAGKMGSGTKRTVSLKLFIFLLIAALLAGFMTAFVLTSNIYLSRLAKQTGQTGSLPSVSGDDKLEAAASLIKSASYYDIDDEILIRSMFAGLSATVGDNYAYYFDEEEFKALTADNNGDNQGIGISVIEDTENSCIKVISVYEGSPAEKAGVRPGDRIVKIGIGEGAEEISGMSYEAAVKQIHGSSGTVAEFTVARGQDLSELIPFSILREHFTTQSVLFHVSALTKGGKKVGVVKITNFDLTTPPQFDKAMDALIGEGCELFVFDLRYNPGGDLASITAVLSRLLNSGDIVIRTKDRAGNEEVTYVKEVAYSSSSDYSTCNVASSDIGKYRAAVAGKSAVLVNGNTASAAELFTSSLKDYGISKIAGTKTFGKGSMQTIINLAYYGYSGAVKVTNKKYFPPLSEGYDGIGIEPDVTVELDEKLSDRNIYDIADEEDNQLRAAIDAIPD